MEKSLKVYPFLFRNLIETIPFGALRGYPKLEKLDLKKNQIGLLSEVYLSVKKVYNEIIRVSQKNALYGFFYIYARPVTFLYMT